MAKIIATLVHEVVDRNSQDNLVLKLHLKKDDKTEYDGYVTIQDTNDDTLLNKRATDAAIAWALEKGATITFNDVRMNHIRKGQE